MATGKLVVMVACSGVEEARNIGRAVVEKRLAACAQVVPGVESVYWWQGKVETATEALLLLKTGGEQWEELQAAVKAAHSYEVPEMLAVPVEAGSAEYLAWMDAEMRRG